MGVIYAVNCDCGEGLNFTVVLDLGDDLVVTAKPCENCQDASFEEGKKEGEKDAS